MAERYPVDAEACQRTRVGLNTQPSLKGRNMPNRTLAPRVQAGVVLAACLSLGCGGDDTNQPTPTPPATAAVTIGDFLFQSGRNATQNPAVDTIAVGGTVTWTWREGEHSVQSLGPPSFESSAISATPGSTYQATFPSAGTYPYDCAVHGPAMTGTVVVR